MIYLDSAATTLQKPPGVSKAMIYAMKTMASPGRGEHTPAMLAAQTAFDCRSLAAELFHVEAPENVVFTFNATHGLNLAIHSLAGRGDRVVVTGYEHNAVMRPLHQIGAKVTVVRTPLFAPDEMTAAFSAALPGAKLAVCTAMSNVFGYITPIQEIAELCRKNGVPLIIDAAQGAGMLDIDFTELGAAFIAMPGHKGLLGPQGTGLLLCGEPGVPLLAGGTGSDSKNPAMPDYLPDRMEAGTHNIPGIAGLMEGLRYVQRTGPDVIATHETNLVYRFGQRVAEIPDMEVWLSPDPSCQGGVLSVRHQRVGCEQLAEALGARGVAVRAGLHCAPIAHETVGTIDTGTVRFSFSPFNTSREAARAADILEDCVKKLARSAK